MEILNTTYKYYILNWKQQEWLYLTTTKNYNLVEINDNKERDYKQRWKDTYVYQCLYRELEKNLR